MTSSRSPATSALVMPMSTFPSGVWWSMESRILRAAKGSCIRMRRARSTSLTSPATSGLRSSAGTVSRQVDRYPSCALSRAPSPNSSTRWLPGSGADGMPTRWTKERTDHRSAASRAASLSIDGGPASTRQPAPGWATRIRSSLRACSTSIRPRGSHRSSHTTPGKGRERRNQRSTSPASGTAQACPALRHQSSALDRRSSSCNRDCAARNTTEPTPRIQSR